MPNIWQVYHVSNCRHTHPPKNKYVFIVCKDMDFMGFLVNSDLSNFILKRPDLLMCQVPLSASDYGFLSHNSYLDCGQLYSFDDAVLVISISNINTKTRSVIKTAVSKAKTIAPRYKGLILGA